MIKENRKKEPFIKKTTFVLLESIAQTFLSAAFVWVFYLAFTILFNFTFSMLLRVPASTPHELYLQMPSPLLWASMTINAPYALLFIVIFVTIFSLFWYVKFDERRSFINGFASLILWILLYQNLTGFRFMSIIYTIQMLFLESLWIAIATICVLILFAILILCLVFLFMTASGTIHSFFVDFIRKLYKSEGISCAKCNALKKEAVK